jgi:hypothetical protein
MLMPEEMPERTEKQKLQMLVDKRTREDDVDWYIVRKYIDLLEAIGDDDDDDVMPMMTRS